MIIKYKIYEVLSEFTNPYHNVFNRGNIVEIESTLLPSYNTIEEAYKALEKLGDEGKTYTILTLITI